MILGLHDSGWDPLDPAGARGLWAQLASHFRCRPGTFNLQPHNPAGCSSCFCFGHSKVCRAAAQFRLHHILSDFCQGKKSPAAAPAGSAPSPG